jgi:hypothetical protein
MQRKHPRYRLIHPWVLQPSWVGIPSEPITQHMLRPLGMTLTSGEELPNHKVHYLFYRVSTSVAPDADVARERTSL